MSFHCNTKERDSGSKEQQPKDDKGRPLDLRCIGITSPKKRVHAGSVAKLIVRKNVALSSLNVVAKALLLIRSHLAEF